MPWQLEKKFCFEASHQLPKHQGKCQRLHGHSWVGWLVCAGNELEKEGSSAGMLVDFGDMKEVINPIVEKYLDHWHLNETTRLENPTSEEVARWIFERVKPKLPSLVAVRIEETCTARCEFRP